MIWKEEKEEKEEKEQEKEEKEERREIRRESLDRGRTEQASEKIS